MEIRYTGKLIRKIRTALSTVHHKAGVDVTPHPLPESAASEKPDMKAILLRAPSLVSPDASSHFQQTQSLAANVGPRVGGNGRADSTSDPLEPSLERKLGTPNVAIACISLDTETNGLHRTRRLLSIALVGYDSKGEIVREYEALLRPEGYGVGPTHIHGITTELARRNGVGFTSIMNNIDAFLESTVSDFKFIGHNVIFDLEVLRSELRIRNLAEGIFADTSRFICTLAMSRLMYPGTGPARGYRHNLGDMYRYLTGKGIENVHTALADARACGLVFHRLRAEMDTRASVFSKHVSK